MSPLLMEFLSAIARFALNGAGYWFVSKGVLTADQTSRMLGPFTDAIVGGAIIAASLAWSLRSKYKARLFEIAARYARVTAPREEIKAMTSDPMIKAQAFSKDA